jgi:thiamine-phosphate pyrophosphorylase
MAEIRGLYAITDPTLIGGERLLPACEQALRGGARLLQYRDKDSDASTRFRNAQALRELCHQYGALFIVNDEPILAKAVKADGVHIGQSDGGVRAARELLGADAIIGVSCHGDARLAQQMADEGASYVAFGRFFPSHTKPQAPGADSAVLASALPVPKVAIGGITPDNAGQLIDAGADAIAVIHGLFASDDIESMARRFATLFPEA